MTSSTTQKEKWEIQLRKGTLELAILAALQQRQLYGLELLKLLHDFQTLNITEGTLYPLLDRLKRDGVISALWQQEGESRPRKYYQLTQAGLIKLNQLTEHWRNTVADIEMLLTKSGHQKQNSKGA